LFALTDQSNDLETGISQVTSALANIPKINAIIVHAAKKEIKRIALDLLDVNITIPFYFDEIIKVGTS
jgi:hypothetical protein